MKKSNRNKPLTHKKLTKLKSLKAKGKPPRKIKVNLGSYSLPDCSEPRIIKDNRDECSYRIEAEISGAVLEKASPGEIINAAYSQIPTTPLNPRLVKKMGKIKKLKGRKNAYFRSSFIPEVSKLDLQRYELLKKRGKEEDLPTNIFGTDDRYIYNDSGFPWRTVGRVWTSTGACTGCTIGPRLVLTASHCVNWLSGGGAGWIKFSPSYYNGNGPWGEYYATRVLYWNQAQGGLSDLETAFDYVVLVMNDYIGNVVGYPGYRSYSSSWNGNAYWQHMGYPGDLTGTQRPAFVGNSTISSSASQSLSGNTGLVLGHFNDITGGHSGGPVWGWWSGESWPRVVGVQSAESANPAFNTSGDNEFGGGQAMSSLISWARSNYP